MSDPRTIRVPHSAIIAMTAWTKELDFMLGELTKLNAQVIKSPDTKVVLDKIRDARDQVWEMRARMEVAP